MRNYSNFIGVGVYLEKEKNYHGSSVFSCRISNSIKKLETWLHVEFTVFLLTVSGKCYAVQMFTQI